MTDRKGRDYLFWLDLETTGSQDSDLVIEIGALITDRQMNEIEAKEFVLPIPEDSEANLPDVVRTMHTVNGLLEDCKKVEWPADSENVWIARIKMMSAIDIELSNWVKKFNGTNHMMFAGSGISHFDRKYVERDLPLLNKRLTYFHMDIGVVRRFLELADIQLTVNYNMSGDKSHRALDDARLHAYEAKRFLEWARWNNE